MSWKLILKALKNHDIQKKMLIVLMIVVIYRFLSHIPIPVGDPGQIKSLIQSAFAQQELFSFVDLLSGGALGNFSIVLLGLIPFINASIIMQILSRILPQVRELQKEGESGRSKVNQYTRLLTLPLALVQSVGSIFIIRQFVQTATGEDIIANASIMQWAIMVASLAAGAMLLMWLGELISEQGIGNGITLIIIISVLTQLPQIVNQFLPGILSEQPYTFITPDLPYVATGLGFEFTSPINITALVIFALFVAISIAVTYLVVKLNEARREVTINYAKRVQGSRTYGGVNSVVPIKLIIAGVMPVIFAVTILSAPNFIGTLMTSADSETLQSIGSKLVAWFGQNAQFAFITEGLTLNTLIYPISYFILVIAFSYVSATLFFNVKDTAENLQKQGAFIPGIRPGKQTEQFLKSVVYRLTFFGSISLGMIAIMPFVVQYITESPLVTIGGTGLLIVVSGAIETMRQIESKALMATYDEPVNLHE